MTLPHTHPPAHPGRVFWLTGLSGSGKTTLAEMLVNWLRSAGRQVVVADGDAVRDLLLPPSGFDRASRLAIARFNGRLCRFLALQGVDVVCPTISLFHEVQDWNRRHIPRYVEIFLDVALEEVMRRDAKGIYARAARGEAGDVVGMDIAAEVPERPDIRLAASLSPDQALQAIVAHGKERGWWEDM